MIFWLLLPLCCFALAVFLHGAAVRLPLRIDAVRRFLLVGFPVGCVLLLYTVRTFGFTVFAFAPVLLYAFACELYIFCFTLVISSVSVTMLIMLRGGPIPASAMASVYDPGRMVELRLARLIKQGFVVQEGERFAVTPAGIRLHRTFTGLQRFFRHAIH
jgi:hypothetical protein